MEHYLKDLWERSMLVAASAYVLARNCTDVNPDEAMLTGMMHGIGKLYVLTRATDHPELFISDTTLNEIIRDWHASIGKAILENWDFSESMAQAVGEQEDLSRDEPGPPNLSDVIAVAILMVLSRRGYSGPGNRLARRRSRGAPGIERSQDPRRDARIRRRSHRPQPSSGELGSGRIAPAHPRRSAAIASAT